MDIFGDTDSKKMPGHLFFGALYLDHKTAVRANIDNQNYSVCPRHWYVEADFKCGTCRREFTWTKGEQKAWFEDYYFWSDARPRHCKACKTYHKSLAELQREYDTEVGTARSHGSSDEKRRIVEIVNQLETAFAGLPAKMIETRDLFVRQLEKAS